MNQEVKICQNCKEQFVIDTQDFQFYEKIKVPPPTFCPACRFQRRLMFRNERVLYKRTCDLCGASILSIFAPDKPYTVYCQPCWWSDKWDGREYAQPYDPSRNFFEQFKELTLKVPFPALINTYTTLVNSDYVNHVGGLKNCYLVFNADYCENALYSTMMTNDKDIADCQMVGESELSYEVINGHKLHRVFFSEDVTDCHNVYFSKSLVGCSDCFGCVNLKNKSHYIFNEPHTKEEYEKKLKEFGLGSFRNIEKFKEEAWALWRKFPHKFMHGRLNVNSSGDYVYECKNARYMYQARYVEDGAYSQWMTLKPAKDIYDLTEWGNGVENIYDSITVGEGANSIKFSSATWSSVSNIEYSFFAGQGSSNLFGCVGMRNKQYCILNKQYPKEEFEKLRAEIIKNMNEHPYLDAKRRTWKYGEFFPYDISLFDYNESTAIQYFPLEKQKVVEHGWRWRDAVLSEYKITMRTEDIPESISETQDSILNEILGCASCGKAFRIIRAELELLRRFELPIPRRCPNCRHMERIRRLNPPYLWERKCVKCGVDVKTSYAPNRPEVVYCESCYNAEVA